MKSFRYTLLLLILVFGSAHAEFVGTDLSTLTKTRKPPVTETDKQQGTFKGSNAAAGAVINTGNTSSSNINASGLLQYTYQNWIDSFNINYQRQQDKTEGLKANRLFAQAQSRYNLDSKQFLYTQLNYIRDKFEGYNYIVNLGAGYGRYITMPQNMTLDWLAGPGINKYQDTNNNTRTRPSVQAGVGYVWNIKPDLEFSENLQSIATVDNVRTISTTGLTNKITDHFSLELMFQAINDNHPPAGKQGFNTITTLQLAYNI
jgi:putative salt-induced outer membrane protein YdiY